MFMEFRRIAVKAELVGNHIAGAVDMGKPVVEHIPKPIIKPVIGGFIIAQMEGKGDIFRLAVKRRRMGHSVFFHMAMNSLLHLQLNFQNPCAAITLSFTNGT